MTAGEGVEAAGHIASEVRKQGDAVLGSLSLFYLVWSPSEWDDVTHIQGGFSQLS